MSDLIVYFRYAETYDKNVGQAVLIDSFLASKLTEGVDVIACMIGENKKFDNGSSQVGSERNAPCRILLIGTIPYHLLTANLYVPAEKGFTVEVDPKYICTDAKNPDYPQEFVRGGDSSC